MTFEDLQIIDPILRALEDENYSSPTSIQAQAIPHVLNHEDILATAQTGTGKTAAFAIPIIQSIQNEIDNGIAKKGIKALVITPTRELAIQIGDSFTTYSKNTDVRNTVIFGGVGQKSQTDAIRRGIDVLIATPGRLLDLMNQGFVKLDKLEYLVLDEADNMLDMGFIHDIRKIIAKIPKNRQTLFFSATMPDNIIELSKQILTNPIHVNVSPVSSTAETIQQYLYYTNKSTKKDLLIEILEQFKVNQALVFSRTKHGADKIVRHLKSKNVNAAAIHGNKSQVQRQKALKQLKNGQIDILVATDIAARGIDIDKLRFVINYDIPNVAETYVHRIGRSGRAGEEGVSISISEPEENSYVKEIENLIKKKIEVVDKNPFPQTEQPMNANQKKDFEKEKNRRKQEFFANRKKTKSNSKKSGNSNKIR